MLETATGTASTKAAASEAATAESASTTATEASATHEDGRTSASWTSIVRVGRLGLSGKGMSAILAKISRLFCDKAVGA